MHKRPTQHVPVPSRVSHRRPSTARVIRMASLAPVSPDLESPAPQDQEAVPAPRARVAREPVTAPHPLPERFVPLQVSRHRRKSIHAGRPLFVLGTARRRRAGWSSRRGGYYALPGSGKPHGLPGLVKGVLAAMGALLLFTVGVSVLTAAGLYGAYLYFSKDLPSIDNIHANEFETTHIYDRNGRLLYDVFD